MKKFTFTVLPILMLMLLACGAKTSESGDDGGLLNAKTFQAKMSSTQNAIILDVRTPQEFAANHIKDAVNINVSSSDFGDKIALLDKSSPLFVYCKAGGRSRTAANVLRSQGFSVYELEGGILKWQSAGLPVEISAKISKSGYTLETYTKAVANHPLTLVDFYAPWCGPCKMMAPHIEELKKKYGDKIAVIKVDTDKSIEVARHFRISAIPLVKLYENGKEVYDKMGYHTQEELEKVLDTYL